MGLLRLWELELRGKVNPLTEFCDFLRATVFQHRSIKLQELDVSTAYCRIQIDLPTPLSHESLQTSDEIFRALGLLLTWHRLLHLIHRVRHLLMGRRSWHSSMLSRLRLRQLASLCLQLHLVISLRVIDAHLLLLRHAHLRIHAHGTHAIAHGRVVLRLVEVRAKSWIRHESLRIVVRCAYSAGMIGWAGRRVRSALLG